MNYGTIKIADCANGLGCRTSLFVSGCTHHCKGCFQPETWNFDFGSAYTKQTEDTIMESIRMPFTDGLTILGGEPMELSNQEAILPLIKKVKEFGKTVWIYSGYTFEQLQNDSRCHGEYTDEILRNIDVLVDGEFHEEEKDITLKFRGSANQRVLDVPKTLKEGKIVFLEEIYG